MYLIYAKDQLLDNFIAYKNEVENQCDVKIKYLRSNKGGEYHFPNYCESVGIIIKLLWLILHNKIEW